MFKFLLVLSSLLAAFAFNPMKAGTAARMQMKVDQPSAAKLFGAALVASSMISMPVLAKEGAGAKLGIFDDSSASSPFAAGIRDDTLYSAYSPYGDGTNAVYKEATPDELKFWTTSFNNAVKRTEKIPTYVNKKTWSEVQGELTRYNYNMREAMLRLAASSKNPTAATAAAKTYFADLGDVFVASKKKTVDGTLAAYDKSVKDLAAFKGLL